MTGRFHTRIVLACVAGSIACAGDRAVEPVVFATLSLRGPATAELEAGAQVQLVPVALDQGGLPIDRTLATLYSSNAPEIASVSSAGRVTGITPGRATISVAATLGFTTRTTDMTIIVRSVLGDDLVLISGERGWEPSVAYVTVGGIVRWRSGPISWSGVDNTKVWLLSPDFHVLDTLDLSGGSATRKFDKAGTITYCSGGCWDPPDFGLVYVR